jgi:hypothetical protein
VGQLSCSSFPTKKAKNNTEKKLYAELQFEIDSVEMFKREMSGKNGRKICKRPVMVSNYGGTMGGRTDILFNMFRELKIERKFVNIRVARHLSKIIGDAIAGVLVGGKMIFCPPTPYQ